MGKRRNRKELPPEIKWGRCIFTDAPTTRRMRTGGDKPPRWIKSGMEKRVLRETKMLSDIAVNSTRSAFKVESSREQRFLQFVRTVSNEKVIHHIKVRGKSVKQSSLWMFLTHSPIKNSFSYGFAYTSDGRSFIIIPKIPPVGHPLRATVQDACVRYAPYLNRVRKEYAEEHVKIKP